MKQILQSLKTGFTELAEVPCPSVKSGHLLIESTCSLLSSGTERMLVEFGKANWLEKARMQPDKVKLVIEKINTDGIKSTIDAVLNKLDQPIPLGYCNVGRVVDIGKGVVGFEMGDRVISNGKHAELVSVPINLCAKVPDNVSDEEASFTVLAAIALQGVRLANPTIGETFVVTGLGLIGLVTVQILRAHGCRVLGLDFDPIKLNLARRFGAEVVDLAAGEDPVKVAEIYSRGRGVDAVLVTATTNSNEPIHQAAQMCRKRGRIVLVGVAGLKLSRDDFFKKELTFQVSASYGPGRYDQNYEEKGQDYPLGFVRWTEQRNFEAVLDLIADGRLYFEDLISHRFDIEEALSAYALVSSKEPSLGILLKYHGNSLTSTKSTVSKLAASSIDERDDTGSNFNLSVSFVGAGNYSTGVLIPAFKKAAVYFRTVASSTGISGLHAGRKFGFDQTCTDSDIIFSDELTKAVVITTQHNSHSSYVIKALEAGKHVFVEKPLCLTFDELEKIEIAYEKASNGPERTPVLMVGFNRRFAPQIQKMMSLLKSVRGPKSFVMTVNSGAVPLDHWTHDVDAGGGRIIGEVCHFIDLLRFMAGSPIESWHRVNMQAPTKDTLTVILKFVNGCIGTVHYFANGSKAFPKERLEVFADGGILQLDNFRKLRGFGWSGFNKMNLWRQDKGQTVCVQKFVDTIYSKLLPPIPIEQILEVSRVSIEISSWKDS